MGDVIRFPVPKRYQKDVQKLLKISNDIDEIIIKALDQGDVEAREIVGVLAHRLGALMRHVEEKGKLWDVCQKVAKKQAAIDT